MNSIPDCHSSTKVIATSEGRGNVRLEIKPLRVPHSASRISRTKTKTPMPRRCLGAKPPPRKATGRLFVCAASDMDQLRIGGGGFFAHQPPQMLLLRLEGGIAIGTLCQRGGQLDHLADLPGAAR